MNAVSLPVLGKAWKSIGPAGEKNSAGTREPPDNFVSGAVEAVATHPTNADYMLIASVNGGIWRTTNAKSSPVKWTPVLDVGACGAIAHDPSDATANTLVASSAFTSSFNNYGFNRFGVVRSIDGGATW